MPQVALMLAPHIQSAVMPKIGELGLALIADVEEVFEIKGKKDVAFSAWNLVYIIGEADVQVEIRYTVGEDEYQRGEPFNPSREDKEKLVQKMSETLKRILKGTAKTVSVWPIPIRESEFSFIEI